MNNHNYPCKVLYWSVEPNPQVWAYGGGGGYCQIETYPTKNERDSMSPIPKKLPSLKTAASNYKKAKKARYAAESARHKASVTLGNAKNAYDSAYTTLSTAADAEATAQRILIEVAGK